MADGYQVGRKGGKDRYVVGYNENKSQAYKVGSGGSAGMSGGGNDSGGGDPVGDKSKFSYSGVDSKDVGDRSPNMNSGGTIETGMRVDDADKNGSVDLDYSEKGSWSDSKNAMARRKALADNASKYYGNDGQFTSPTVDIYPAKK